MRIETERLILRDFKETDLDDLYDYLSKITVHCFLEFKVNTIEEAQKALGMRVNHQEEVYVAIELKETNKVIGEIFVDSFDESPNGTNPDTYSPCWMLNEKYQKCGYMYEAVKAIYDYLFTNTICRRIYAYTEDYNIASQNLCKKLGMRQEGFYREFVSFIKDDDGNPVYENTLEFAILKKEWMK